MKTNQTKRISGIGMLIFMQLIPIVCCGKYSIYIEKYPLKSNTTFYADMIPISLDIGNVEIDLKLSGDTIAQQITATSGNNYSNSSGSISYTIGEPVTVTLQEENAILTQGFQQGEITVNIIYVDPTSSIEITAFPNPTSEYVFLKTENFDGLQYVLYSVDGKEIEQGILFEGECEINFTTFKSSTYILKVFKEKTEIKSFKIVKN